MGSGCAALCCLSVLAETVPLVVHVVEHTRRVLDVFVSVCGCIFFNGVPFPGVCTFSQFYLGLCTFFEDLVRFGLGPVIG